ncbi:N-acetylmuramoyl-L-alanine amidase, partial [Streptomyces sp. NPDC005953]
MPVPMPAEQLLQALRDEGLKVVQVGDWRTHNRNAKGPWGPVHGV